MSKSLESIKKLDAANHKNQTNYMETYTYQTLLGLNKFYLPNFWLKRMKKENNKLFMVFLGI